MERILCRRKPSANHVASDLLRPSLLWTANAPTLHPQLGHSISKIAITRPQTKLTVSQPGDSYEQEADQIAGRITGMSDPGSRATTPSSQSVSSAPQQGLSKSADVSPIAEAGIQSGEPLDAATRAFMESRFGHDFSQVRVHTDAKASQAAQGLGAQAYTLGSDVIFDSDHYDPHSAGGRHLLAHELTHVVQQGGAPAAHSGGAAISAAPVATKSSPPAVHRMLANTQALGMGMGFPDLLLPNGAGNSASQPAGMNPGFPDICLTPGGGNNASQYVPPTGGGGSGGGGGFDGGGSTDFSLPTLLSEILS